MFGDSFSFTASSIPPMIRSNISVTTLIFISMPSFYRIIIVWCETDLVEVTLSSRICLIIVGVLNRNGIWYDFWLVLDLAWGVYICSTHCAFDQWAYRCFELFLLVAIDCGDSTQLILLSYQRTESSALVDLL